MESLDKTFTDKEPKIVFGDDPKEVQHPREEFIERKKQLITFIEPIVKSQELFKGKNVQVSFSPDGVSSLVSFLDTGDQKYVLRIPLDPTPLEGEVETLKAWEAQGAKVPYIFAEDKINDAPYMIMEYVDAQTLISLSTEELLDQHKYEQMGELLRKMHGSRIQGYGRIKDGKGKYDHFSDWLNDRNIRERIEYCKHHDVLNDAEHGSIKTALEILATFVANHPTTTYCHDDFATYNILNSEPLTVIDPNSKANNPYIDLGRTLLIAAKQDDDRLDEIHGQILRGYFQNEDFDKRALQASILHSAFMKCSSWHKHNKKSSIEAVRKYLSKNKDLIE